MPSPFPSIPGDDPLARTGTREIRSCIELLEFAKNRDDRAALTILADGDPLRLVKRTLDRLEKRCLLLDIRSVVYGAMPFVVATAGMLDGTEDLTKWLEGSIDVAVEGLLEDDARRAREDHPVDEPIEPRFLFVMQTLAFSPRQIRRVVVAANDLPKDERHVFFHAFVMAKGFTWYEQHTGLDQFDAQRLLVRGIDRLSRAVGDIE